MLTREQGLDSPERLSDLTDKNVNDICNLTRKPDSKNVNGTPNRGQQVSVIVQENLKLAAFLFHHRRRCTLDWEIMGVNGGTVCLSVGQTKLNNEYKDPDVLSKINKSDLAGTMESIKEYLSSCLGVIQAPLSFAIRKTIIVQTYGNYPTYTTPDDEMITRMLQLPKEKNKLLHETNAFNSPSTYSRV